MRRPIRGPFAMRFNHSVIPFQSDSEYMAKVFVETEYRESHRCGSAYPEITLIEKGEPIMKYDGKWIDLRQGIPTEYRRP